MYQSKIGIKLLPKKLTFDFRCVHYVTAKTRNSLKLKLTIVKITIIHKTSFVKTSFDWLKLKLSIVSIKVIEINFN